MKTYLVIGLLFLSASSEAFAFGKKPVTVPPAPTPAPAPKPTPAPKPAPSPVLESTCPAAGSVQAVDLSEPVDQPFLDAMKSLKVNTIIRYYDQTNETLPGKTLLPPEAELLARNGFDVMVVFQHNNNQISSFTAARGASDANRSLQLAAQDGQTKGSAIYFGVDGDWNAAADVTAIQTYFAKAAPIVRAAGFKAGAYGSGLTCARLLQAKLVDYCWLANATGWPQYQTFFATQAWSMVQKLPRDCGGKNVDFDVVNSGMRDLGQFRP